MVRRSKKTKDSDRPETRAPELDEQPDEDAVFSDSIEDAPRVTDDDASDQEQVDEIAGEPVGGPDMPGSDEQSDEPPTADEFFGDGPTDEDLEAAGYDDGRAAAIRAVYADMVAQVREILKPGLVPGASVQISSTAKRGHWRAGRKWISKPELFAVDDPFLSKETTKALESDPRIRIKFPE